MQASGREKLRNGPTMPMLKGKSLAQARREVAALQPGETWATDHPITIEEFNLITPDDTHAELFEGAIHMPAPSMWHEMAYAFCFALLKAFVDAKRLGEVLGSRSAIRLSIYSAPQPDIVFVAQNRRQIIRDLEIIEPPDLIMELVWSVSGRQRALAKMLRYEEFRVPEFWYIDLPRKLARIHHLNRKGKYTVGFQGSRGVMRSKMVPGFAMQARWLWSEPGKFPSVYSVVQELVAGRVPR